MKIGNVKIAFYTASYWQNVIVKVKFIDSKLWKQRLFKIKLCIFYFYQDRKVTLFATKVLKTLPSQIIFKNLSNTIKNLLQQIAKQNQFNNQPKIKVSVFIYSKENQQDKWVKEKIQKDEINYVWKQ